MSRYRRLVAEIAGHKSELNKHRKALRLKSAERDAVVSELAAAGINIITGPQGTGAIHSHAADRPGH